MKCKRCGRILYSKKSIERGYGLWCYRIIKGISELKGVVIADIVERVRKLELDNKFMKYQLKHKPFSVTSHPDASLDWDRIKPEVKEVIDEFKGVFGKVVRELRTLFEENKPVLIRDFRFTDKELGIKIEEVK